MKKLIVLIITLCLILAMAVPAYACTPKLQVPSVPSVPKIRVEIQLPDSFWDNWFAMNPITFQVPRYGCT